MSASAIRLGERSKAAAISVVRKRCREAVAAQQIKISRLDTSGEAFDFEGVAIGADSACDDVPLRMAPGFARRQPARVHQLLHQRMIAREQSDFARPR